MQTFSWNAAIVALALLAIAFGAWASMRKPKNAIRLPTVWALTARPVFSHDERRVYRLLREALPDHIVLSKLPLVRFCQPVDPHEVRYWFNLLGTSHVTFAVCSANGRVLAAVDLDTDRSNSPRAVKIKQSVLSACRVRLLRCPVDHLPTVAEIQSLVPSHAAPAHGPQAASGSGAGSGSGFASAFAAPANLHKARDTLSSTVATRRAERTALWQDSTTFQDSFFAPDMRPDSIASNDLAAPHTLDPATSFAPRGVPHASIDDSRQNAHFDADGGGVVSDVAVDAANNVAGHEPRFSRASGR